MKKIYIGIILLFIMAFGVQANAFDVQAGEELYITQEINGDLYAAGGKVDINAPVNGDLIIAGGELNIHASIKEDLIIAGGDLVISGSIGDDVRAAGGTIKINSDIQGDLIIGSGDVRIGKDVRIGGDLIVGAGRIWLEGDVKGNAKIAASQFTLNGTIHGDAELSLGKFKNPIKTGRIIGNLDYKSDEKIEILEDISEGGVLFTQNMIKEEVKEGLIGFVASYLVVKIVGVFLFASLMYFFFVKLCTQISENLRKQTGKSFLYGFVTILGFPIVILLLLISIIGIPFALFFLFFYIFIFVFLSLINVIVLSSLFIHKYKIRKLYQKLLIIFAFTFLLVLVNGINIIIGFFTIGAVAIKKLDFFKSIIK